MCRDVGNNIQKVQTAQNHTAHYALFGPFASFGKQVAKHQDTGQTKRHQQITGKSGTAFRHLFEQNIDDAVAAPDAQKQHYLRAEAAGFLAAIAFPKQEKQCRKCQYQTDQTAFGQLLMEKRE